VTEPSDTEPLDALWGAYRATTYTARFPTAVVRIRVGAACAGLDGELADRNLTTWAYITAANPDSVPLSDDQNAARYQALLRAVESLRWPCFSGAGVPDDPSWAPEKSLLVLGIPQPQAIELGQRFDQRAILWGTLGGLPELIACR